MRYIPQANPYYIGLMQSYTGFRLLYGCSICILPIHTFCPPPPPILSSIGGGVQLAQSCVCILPAQD